MKRLITLIVFLAVLFSFWMLSIATEEDIETSNMEQHEKKIAKNTESDTVVLPDTIVLYP